MLGFSSISQSIQIKVLFISKIKVFFLRVDSIVRNFANIKR